MCGDVPPKAGRLLPFAGAAALNALGIELHGAGARETAFDAHTCDVGIGAVVGDAQWKYAAADPRPKSLAATIYCGSDQRLAAKC